MAKKKSKLQPESTEPTPETAAETETPRIEDPIGDTTDGEAAVALKAEPELEAEAKPKRAKRATPRKKPAQPKGAPQPAEEPAVVPELDPSPAETAEDSAHTSAPEQVLLSIPSESTSLPETPEAETEPATEVNAKSETMEASEAEDDSEAEADARPRPPAKLERLQKILAAAGIASRRSAEALIEQGRVQVNGKVVTVLGTKADAGRDHIRVDGKLLQGAERLRYFVLNKPRGFVTTVKDPEGRPTVMQFFEKMKERLYPVGRLDYMSEGLLVVTNDGELANRLTKASSGVEKTYLVKVAGQPTEAELNILRGGVAIERGAPGSPKVHTSPARIRQVRQGDNPWYEVVLIEGRNRELRKMFEEVGHFVEKIRRTGYGPLVLDQEPGKLRELEPRELELLRLAAEGKLRTPKSKDLRRRNAADAGILPTVRPKPTSHPRPPVRPFAPPPAATEGPAPYPSKSFGSDRTSRLARTYDKRGPAKPFQPAKPFPSDKPFRPERGAAEGFRPAAGRTSAPNPVRSFSHVEDEGSRRRDRGGQANFGTARPRGRSFDRPAPEGRGFDRPSSGPTRPTSAGTGRPAPGRPFTSKPKFDKPAWKKPERPQRSESHDRSQRPPRPDRPGRPAFQRPAPPRREAPVRPVRDFDDDLGPVRPPNLHIEEIKSDHQDHPHTAPARPYKPRPFQASNFEQRSAAPRSSAPKPFRGEGGLARPFTTSSGKPRAGGARPSSKPGFRADRSSSAGRKPNKFSKPGSSRPGSFKSYGDKPAGRSSAGPAKRPYQRDEGQGSFTPRPRADSASRPSSSSRPFTPRPERKSGPGWKPKPGAPADRSSSVGWKPAFGGQGKPSSGSHSKPKPGGFKSSGYKGKPTGPRSGAKRPGGKN
jgi:23S rRNA pseudouridine2605 synthase